MNISPVGGTPVGGFGVTSAKPASDGDTAAVEARETSATKKAEQLNGGVQPKATSTLPTTAQTGGVNKVI